MLWSLLLVSGLAVGAVYAIAGLGLVQLYRATGVLNFAQGAIGAFGALLAWQWAEWGYPAPLGWAAALLVAMAVSAAYGAWVAPALAYREPVIKAVATLGLTLMLLGLMNWLWPQNPRQLALPTDGLGVQVLGVRLTGTRLLALAAAVAVSAGMGVLLACTRTGLAMRALADRRELALLLGIRVRRVEIVAWLVSGLLCGIGGLLLGSLVRLDAAVLSFLVIPAMAAAIVGGLRSLPWTLAAGLLIGVAEALATLSAALAPYRAATPFVVAMLAIGLQRRGQRLVLAADD